MNELVVQILAVGLTLSQLFTRPADFKTHFDADKDSAEIQQLLHAGCEFVQSEFHTQKLPLDALFSTLVTTSTPTTAAPEDMGSLTSSSAPEQMVANAPAAAPPSDTPVSGFSLGKLKEKLDIPLAYTVYKQFCKGDKTGPPVDLHDAINLYNKAFTDIPDVGTLKNYKFKQSSTILDGDGLKFSEMYVDANRRKVIPLQQIPEVVQKAFVAAEDQNFYTHKGLDIRGIIRAFKSRFTQKDKKHFEGGSTITQQVIKNLLLNDDPKIERKMLEMYLAVQLEKVLTKQEILELYMNFVFLGRSSWGVEMAAQNYFGKSIREVDLAETAMLASLVKGPTAFSPLLHRPELQERREYVLKRMTDDQMIKEDAATSAAQEQPKLVAYASPRAHSAFYFLDEIQRDARRVAGIQSLTDSSYTVRSTIHPKLQQAVELALQDGLAEYEQTAKRVGKFEPEGSIADAIDRGTTWQEEMANLHPLHYDIQWPIAVVLSANDPTTVKLANGRTKTYGTGYKVGLQDGTTLPLTNGANHNLSKYDLLYVKISSDGKSATLRTLPQVQGAIVVLEAKTGRVLAMSGGFSYSLNQLNRVTRTARPCGSTLKPFIYLSALNLGYQPNTLIANTLLTLPRLDPKGEDWEPQNYTRGTGGYVTIRHAVEQSLNLPTARIMSLIGQTPSAGLDYIRGITQELGIYKNPVRYYPFVLGAQDTRLLDMAVAYATIANIGLKPTPHFIDSIEQDGKLVYQRPRFSLQPIPSVDRMAFYQIRHILEGSVERGTANKMKDLTGFVAGKTGTTNNDNDAWFVGFTNDIVVATWIGYDSRKIKTSLGENMTGAGIALPIAERVLRKSFEIYKPREPLVGPPAEIASQVVPYPIDPITGEFNQGSYIEAFRSDGRPGVPRDTRYSLLRGSEGSMGYAQGPIGDEDDPNFNEAPQHFQQPEYRDPYAVPNQPTYQPGGEDPQELRRRRGAQPDTIFSNPFYR